MSSKVAEIKSVFLDGTDVHVTQYYGGDARGRMLQLTQGGQYLQVTVREAAELARVLEKWVAVTGEGAAGARACAAVWCKQCDKAHGVGIVEILGVEEGPAGEDMLTFRCPRTGYVHRATVHGRR